MGKEAWNKWVARAVLFIVVAACVALGLYLEVVVGVNKRWISVLALTLTLLGVVALKSRDMWNCGRYWLTLAACLMAHFALLVAVQRYLPELPLAVLGFVGTLEFGGIFWLLLTVCE